METRRITKENFFAILGAGDRPWQDDYLVMYSSVWPGFTTDPDLMLVPIDDHLVHRGDGVFEVIRCIQGNIYQLDGHLERLEKSAKAISLRLSTDYSDIKEIIKTLVSIGREKNCLIKVVLSRGPGSFGVNPYDCPESQIYANVIRFRGVPEEFHTKGVSLITSRIPVKKSFFATIKSCNYLPNVLMKMEAIDAGFQFAVALDEEGFLAEGPTENIGVLTEDNVMIFPRFERTLSGITANRVFQLAHILIEEKMIKAVKFDKVLPDDAYRAREIFLTGTSIDVLPVVIYDKKKIGGGIPGPVCSKLRELLQHDMTMNQDILTKVDL